MVADAVYTTPREGMLPTMYVPLAQREPRQWNSWRDAALTIKAASGQRALVERDVAAALTQADPTLVFSSGTFDQIVDATVTQERLVAMMSGFFGALALLLAGLGLYGTVAHAVSARRTEIGLRVALGAQPAGIVRLVFRRVGVLIAAGAGPRPGRPPLYWLPWACWPRGCRQGARRRSTYLLENHKVFLRYLEAAWASANWLKTSCRMHSSR